MRQGRARQRCRSRKYFKVGSRVKMKGSPALKKIIEEGLGKRLQNLLRAGGGPLRPLEGKSDIPSLILRKRKLN